jgi:hypothetical protein
LGINLNLNFTCLELDTIVLIKKKIEEDDRIFSRKPRRVRRELSFRNQNIVLQRYKDLDLLKTGGTSKLFCTKKSIKVIFLKCKTEEIKNLNGFILDITLGVLLKS